MPPTGVICLLAFGQTAQYRTSNPRLYSNRTAHASSQRTVHDVSYSSFYWLEYFHTLSNFSIQLTICLFVIFYCLASCHGLALGGSLDEIVRWLSRYRTGLQTLDTWRSGHFTNHGIEMLMGLVHLRELDIGWWYNAHSFSFFFLFFYFF